MEIDKKLIELYKGICKINDNIIQTKDRIAPILFLIEENRIGVINPSFDNPETKERIRNLIFKIIASMRLKGYILITDTKMTRFDKKRKTAEVMDAVMRNLYTPKGKIGEIVIHKDRQIIEKMDFNKELKKSWDDWDFWGEHHDYTDKEQRKIAEDFAKFKEEHKDLY